MVSMATSIRLISHMCQVKLELARVWVVKLRTLDVASHCDLLEVAH